MAAEQLVRILDGQETDIGGVVYVAGDRVRVPVKAAAALAKKGAAEPVDE